MAVPVVPDEYQHIYRPIPTGEKESFTHSLRTMSGDQHRYITISQAIEKTMQVYTNPSPYWYLLYARMSFVATRYEELDEFYTQTSDMYRHIVSPFLGRIKAFQNSYDEAITLAKETLEHLNMEEPQLLDVILYFEAKYTLGLAYAYTRQFDRANEIIADLEAASTKFMYKKLIGEDHLLDYVIIENIIKSYTLFFSGHPQEMADVLATMREWIVNVKDPWLQGFYYNVYGISKIMFQELAEAERALRVAFKKFEEVNDLRGYSTVGANLGMSLLTKGKRTEGREYLEAVIGPQVSMKNYWLAMGNMLEVAKSLLEEKKVDEATKILTEAEEISRTHNIGDPNTYSMFSFYYSRIGELDKAEEYLQKLREIKDKGEDQYTDLFYYMAAAINAMHRGDLNQAHIDILVGIEIADKSNYYNYALELSMVHLEIILKRYLVEQNEEYILKALEIVRDLNPLIQMTDNPFYETLFYLLAAYLLLAVENFSEASENFDMADEIAQDSEETAQYKELSLFKERREFITSQKPADAASSSLYDEFVSNWLSDEYLPVFYLLEAKRLLQNLQFEKTSLEQMKEDDVKPKLLFIVGGGGITIYTHRFDDDETIDEVLVGGFLSALTTFSQELFGGGLLTRIDQENHVLLMEKISEDNILVMILDKETYMLRKKFKQFSTELAKSKLVEYINTDFVLSEFDPQFQILEGIIEVVFGTEIEEEKIEETSASEPAVPEGPTEEKEESKEPEPELSQEEQKQKMSETIGKTAEQTEEISSDGKTSNRNEEVVEEYVPSFMQYEDQED